MKYKFSLVIPAFIVYLLFIYSSCSDNPVVTPPPPNGDDKVKNTITIETVWLELKAVALKITPSTIDTSSDFSYTLIRNDENSNETVIPLNTLIDDTTLIDNNEGLGLTPGMTYGYKVEAKDTQNELRDTSRTLSVETLSPTSHSYEWQVDTLGQPGNFLYDVWGTDANNVWAIGYVNLPEDIAGIIKWDGQAWNPFTSFEGAKQSIFGFDESNIFIVGEFGAYGVIGRWDGSKWNIDNFFYDPLDQDTVWALRSVWGNNSNDVWAVGDHGTIVHWDGQVWNKVVGIDARYTLWDIWGLDNSSIYVIGNERNQNMILYKYNGNEFNPIVNRPTSSSIRSSVWGPNKERIYALDLEKYEIINGSITTFTIPGQESAINKIRGSGANNLFTVGAFGEVIHFNGETWDKQNELYIYPNSRLLRGIWVEGTKVFIVGQTANNGAVVVQGTIN